MKKKVIIIGADLRNPQLHKYIGLGKEKMGLTNFLYNSKTNYTEIINNRILDNEFLDVIISGAIPPNPAELISNGRFEELINILKKEYLSRGFVFVEVSKPRVVINDDDKSVSIEYGIAEKQQVFVRNILIKKVSDDLQVGAKRSLVNQEGSPVNIVELENDLRKLVLHFQQQLSGYYWPLLYSCSS